MRRGNKDITYVSNGCVILSLSLSLSHTYKQKFNFKIYFFSCFKFMVAVFCSKKQPITIKQGIQFRTVPYRPVWPVYTLSVSAPVQVHPLFCTGKNISRTGLVPAKSGCFGQ